MVQFSEKIGSWGGVGYRDFFANFWGHFDVCLFSVFRHRFTVTHPFWESVASLRKNKFLQVNSDGIKSYRNGGYASWDPPWWRQCSSIYPHVSYYTLPSIRVWASHEWRNKTFSLELIFRPTSSQKYLNDLLFLASVFYLAGFVWALEGGCVWLRVT